MTAATYAPRAAAHPTRTGKPRRVPILWLVLHTSEGGEGDPSAENLASYIGTPRVVDLATGRIINTASYHYIFDTDDVIPVVPDPLIAFAAGGGNEQGLHACFPGKAAQTVEQWDDRVSNDYLEQAARWLVDKAAEHGIPLVKITPAELRSGERGVCGHHDVSLAFGKSDHTDPGKAFPWSELIDRARAIANPPPPQEDDDMANKAVAVKAQGADASFAMPVSGPLTWIRSGREFSRLRDTGLLICRSADGLSFDDFTVEELQDAIRSRGLDGVDTPPGYVRP